jgi:ACR3 family arsenite transporter
LQAFQASLNFATEPLIAVPLLLQGCGIFSLTYGWTYLWRVPFSTAAPAALIGTSNFFELAVAVAVAISLFGLNSGAALATVVEVPVMLLLVAITNRTRTMFSQD